ncbi:hypothetical protein MA16_Dca009360 [Dendrobium catenatum]|uniref:Uncharacterized protein n=1 Tax=Dendrobium catenatum TaxID=906689 RepID=A0A2I0XH26_9ASPA|nr:hypothetical protein MA16_Dca009360 [Dendrobium catenatum]
MDGRLTALEEMMKKMLEGKPNPTTSETREATGDNGRYRNLNPLRGRDTTEVEILDGNDGMPPLEPLSREEMSMGYERRGAEFFGRRDEFYRRGAEEERRREEYEEGRGRCRDCKRHCFGSFAGTNSRLLRLSLQVGYEVTQFGRKQRTGSNRCELTFSLPPPLHLLRSCSTSHPLTTLPCCRGTRRETYDKVSERPLGPQNPTLGVCDEPANHLYKIFLAWWEGNSVRCVRQSRDTQKYPLAGKRLLFLLQQVLVEDPYTLFLAW